MKKLYVVGNKVSKSLSPTIFNYWFKKYNIKASYGYLELTEKNFHNKIKDVLEKKDTLGLNVTCLLYTSPSPRDLSTSRMPSSA